MYHALRSAAIDARNVDRRTRRRGHHQLAQTLDLLIIEANGDQAGRISWAMDNGYPEYETVLSYGNLMPSCE